MSRVQTKGRVNKLGFLKTLLDIVFVCVHILAPQKLFFLRSSICEFYLVGNFEVQATGLDID